MLLVDGARHQIESIQAEADRRGVTVHILREKERLYLQADQHEYQLGA